MPNHIQIHTGPDRWQLQTDEDVFWIDIWAVEAIAKVVRHVDKLGDVYSITLEKKTIE